MIRKPHILAALSVLALTGCATVAPRVDVLGMAPHAGADSALLFVEVTNPTQRPLELSRLRYNVQGPEEFKAQGEVRLERNVTAGASAIIEVPIQTWHVAASGGPIILTGRLYARDESIERSWKISARGAMPGGQQSMDEPIRIRVADAALR